MGAWHSEDLTLRAMPPDLAGQENLSGLVYVGPQDSSPVWSGDRQEQSCEKVKLHSSHSGQSARKTLPAGCTPSGTPRSDHNLMLVGMLT